MESRPPLHLGVIAIEKGAFGSPSTTVPSFTDLSIKPRREEKFHEIQKYCRAEKH